MIKKKCLNIPSFRQFFSKFKIPSNSWNIAMETYEFKIKIHNLKTDRLKYSFKKEVISENHTKSWHFIILLQTDTLLTIAWLFENWLNRRKWYSEISTPKIYLRMWTKSTAFVATSTKSINGPFRSKTRKVRKKWCTWRSWQQTLSLGNAGVFHTPHLVELLPRICKTCYLSGQVWLDVVIKNSDTKSLKKMQDNEM